MAEGDITFFEEALDDAFFDGWASTDEIWCAILDDTTSPTAAFGTPALGDFTEVGTSGIYVSGGLLLGTYGAMSVEAGGILTFDTATNPVWALHASNDTDAYWGLVYNADAAGDPAIMYVDLGGPVDMQPGSLTITWHANGLYRITIA